MQIPRLFPLPMLALLASCAAQADPARGRTGGGSDTGTTQTDSGGLDTGAADTSADTAEDTGAADTSTDTTPAGPTIEIATWNTARFFDRVCDSGRCDAGQNDYEELPSAAQFQYKTSQLATGITRQDADIMLLQEVESQDCIDALIAALPAGRWPVAVLGEMGQDASPPTSAPRATTTRPAGSLRLAEQQRLSPPLPPHRLTRSLYSAATSTIPRTRSRCSRSPLPASSCGSLRTSSPTTGPTPSIHSETPSTTCSSRPPPRAATSLAQRPCSATQPAVS